MLKKLLILLLSIFCFNKYGMPTTEALEGAGVKELRSNEFPFSVAVIHSDYKENTLDQYVCGGTLITRRHVLLGEIRIDRRYPLTSYSILAGSHNLILRQNGPMKSYQIDSYNTYDKWAKDMKKKSKREYSELAVAQLRGEITDPNVKPIGLSSIKFDDLPNLPVVMAGWDDTLRSQSRHNFMKKVDLKILAMRECELIDIDADASSQEALKLLFASRTLMCSVAGPSVTGTYGSGGIPVFTIATKPQLVGIFSGSRQIPKKGHQYIHYVTVLDLYREFILNMTRA